MILQALHDYYLRRQAEPDPTLRLPEPGFARQDIAFILELDTQGRLLGILDVRVLRKNKLFGTPRLLPEDTGRSSDVKANLFWDNAEYALGIPSSAKLATRAARAYLTRVRKMHEAFVHAIHTLPSGALADPGVHALLRFLDSDVRVGLAAFPAATEIATINPWISFRLAGDDDLICLRPLVRQAINAQWARAETDATTGQCLITGFDTLITRKHPKIFRVRGAKPSGGLLVSFNDLAYQSYGKEQGENAPVSKLAAFAYGTALNTLMDHGSAQKVEVGDTTAVFWAQRQDDQQIEEWLRALVSGDNPDAHVVQVKALYESVRSGAFDGARGDNRFYVLGLAPNEARLAIRFWHAAPLREVATSIRTWFDDLDVDCATNERRHPPLYHLLSRVCVRTKDKPFGDISKLPPSMAGEVLRAAMTGAQLPGSLLNAALQRIRAEQSIKDDVTGKPVLHVSAARASILKACLNRKRRIQSFNLKEMTVSLDKSNREPLYLWGRKFAAFELIQERAAERELNRTIRDAYFSSAMTSPRTVYGRLAMLDQIHLRDLKRSQPKAGAFFGGLILEISSPMDANPAVSIPALSTPEQQASFALGYYHQRHALITKR